MHANSRPEPPEWVSELNEVHTLLERGDYRSADAALNAFERRWPIAHGWAAYTRAILCMHSRSIEETLTAITRALADETLGDGGRVHLSELLIQHHGETGDTQALRQAMHEMLDHRVTDSGVLEIVTKHAETHNLTDVLARLRSGLTGQVPPRGVSWFRDRAESSDASDDRLARAIPVHECEEVTLVNRQRGLYVFDAAGNLVRDCATSTTAAAVEGARALAAAQDAPSVEGTAVLIQDRFLKPNYCHWIFDWVPRLELARASALTADFVIGHELTQRFERESLDFAGTPADRFIPTAGSPALRVERLLVPDTCFRVRHPVAGANRALMEWWRGLVAERVGPIEPRGERLYLARTGTRSIREDTELRMLLERSGFRALEPGDSQFRDQLDVFRGASAIVAPHGAALANILFAPGECRVLELFASRGGGTQFEEVATALGQDYTALRDPGSPPAFSAHHNNLPITTVDFDAVEEWLLGCNE
jgi:capsular polysaccharide biosynthesis protein